MKCPVCSSEQLVMSERQGIEIDYCPKCRGIWLDRGELDKIIERVSEQSGSVERSSGRQQPPAQPMQPPHAQPHQPVQQGYYPPQQPQHRPDKSMYDSDYGTYRYKKRKHWLLEIFD
jgi:hypothetical protein